MSLQEQNCIKLLKFKISQVILTSLVLNYLLSNILGTTSGHWFGKKERRVPICFLLLTLQPCLHNTGNSRCSKIIILLLRCQSIWLSAKGWTLSVYFWCESSQQSGERTRHIVFGSDCLQSLNMKIVLGIFLNNFTEKWVSNNWKYKCRKRGEELVTLEMLLFFFLGLFTCLEWPPKHFCSACII